MRTCASVIAFCGVVASARAGVLTVVAKTGDTISGHTITNLFNRPFINNAGQVAYTGDYVGGEAIFRDHAAVVSAGDDLGGDTFSIIYAGQPVMNNAGTIGFTYRNPSSVTHIAGTDGFQSTFGPLDGFNLLSVGNVGMNDFGTFSFFSQVADGGIQSIMANQSHIQVKTPATIDGYSFNQIDGQSYVNINNSGTFTFRADNTSGPTNAVMTQSKVIAGTGSVVFGQTLNSVGFYPAINNAGTVAYQAAFSGNSATGIFTTNSGLILKTGTAAGGHTVNGFGLNFSGFVDINSTGTVSFLANYIGGGGGVFVNSSLALSTGDIVNGKTITALSDPVINDSGIFTVWAQFSDNSQAILTGTVPEPAGIIAAATIAICARRRRSK